MDPDQAAPGLPHEGGLRGLRHFLAWTVGRRLRYRVAGPSMGATLAPGTEVLIDPRPRRPLRPGDVVLARHPTRPETRIVKRVAEVTATGDLVLRGDDPSHSTDSRDFGVVPAAAVIGRVVWVFPV